MRKNRRPFGGLILYVFDSVCNDWVEYDIDCDDDIGFEDGVDAGVNHIFFAHLVSWNCHILLAGHHFQPNKICTKTSLNGCVDSNHEPWKKLHQKKADPVGSQWIWGSAFLRNAPNSSFQAPPLTRFSHDHLEFLVLLGSKKLVFSDSIVEVDGPGASHLAIRSGIRAVFSQVLETWKQMTWTDSHFFHASS